jgi:uncharacterized protein (UPF0548 family)
MPLIATEKAGFSNVVKQELWPDAAYCRAVVTVNETVAKAYQAGTVLGKVTASGKHKIAVQTASDGSQVADAIVLGEVAVAANTDTKVLVLIKGPAIIGKGGLVLDATYDTAPELAAVYAALEAKGIQCNDTIVTA